MNILFSERRTRRMVIPNSHYIRHRARFTSHSCLLGSDRTHSCRDIRPGLHPCAEIFAVFAHFTLGILRAKAMEKRAFLQLVPRTGYAPQRPVFATLYSPDTFRAFVVYAICEFSGLHYNSSQSYKGMFYSAAAGRQ